MLNADGKRELAYVDEVHDIQPIKGADNIELVHVEAWKLIAKKGEFKEGDKCIFFEIDSKLPKYDKRFDFMEKKGWKVRTMKLSKFGVFSEGLAMPLSEFPEISQDSLSHTFVTTQLGITYYDPEDVVRKSNPGVDRIASYKKKHSKFFNNKFIQFLMKFKFFRDLFLHSVMSKKRSEKDFPSQYVSKTDEERIQNMPGILSNKDPWVVTEKVDGTSSTYLLVRKPLGGDEFYVCSRNVRMLSPKSETFLDSQKHKDELLQESGEEPVEVEGNNIYWENAHRYNIEKHLKDYLSEHKDIKWVCIQGESYGEGWQGNPLRQKGHDLRVFNFKDSKNGRWGSIEGKTLIESWGMKWVPILYTDFVLPDTVDKLLDDATGMSTINPERAREGWVLRSLDGKQSFKAVSPEYLASKK